VVEVIGKRTGAGGGFGVSASPVGAYVIKDGTVTWKPAVNINRLILGWQLVALAAVVVGWRRMRR